MTPMKFITLDAFKEAIGVDKIDIVFRKETGTTFGIHAKGTVKVQKDLDPKKPIRYMYEEENFPAGCIINVKPVTAKFTL